MRKYLLLGGFLIVFNCLTAQWISIPTINNPVCTTNNTLGKTATIAVSDGSGGMWVAWEDTTNKATTGTDILIQQLKSDGTIAFAASGVIVCNAVGNQTSIAMAADGAGGCVLAWTDTRTTLTTSNDVYAQRISNTGAALWATNGVVVSNGTVTELGAVVERINGAEVLIGWRDGRNATTNQDYYCNKLSLTNGSKVWTNDLEIVAANNIQTNLRLLADGLGNCFCLWQDPRVATTNADMFVQKVNNNGTVAWAANGINITAIATNNQNNPQITSDGTGGFIAVWDDNRTATADQDIYAQRIDANGVVQWTSGGVAVAAVSGSNQRNPYLVSDGANGAIITWQDLRNTATSSNDIYAQRINGSGIVQWAANGVVICNAANSQPNSTTTGFSIQSDGASGAIIIWDDALNTSTDIDVRAQRVNATGVVQWAANGIAVATHVGTSQRSPMSVSDGLNGAIVVWQDGRSGTANGELYGSRIMANGLLPVVFTRLSAEKNNNNIIVNWQTANEVNTQQYIVERSSNGIDFKALKSTAAKGFGNNAYTVVDNKPFVGNNFYRIQSVDVDSKVQYSNTVKVNTEKMNVLAFSVHPNPTNNNATVTIKNALNGKYVLRVIDITGKIQQQLNTSIIGSELTLPLPLNGLSKANYIVQLVNSTGEIVANTVITKQ